MAILLSLLTAACFGASDFSGGIATKRRAVSQVIFGAHTIGLIAVSGFALLTADAFTWRDLGIGAIGGVFGGVGYVLFYRRLAIGPMHVVTPLTALTSAGVPALWGLLSGETLTFRGWCGVALGLLAVLLVSWSRADTPTSVSPQAVIESLIAGAGFGAVFICLDLAADATTPWPVVGGRLATLTLVLLYLATRPKPRMARPVLTRYVVAAGILDTAGNVIYLYAVNAGDLAVVSILAGLYPIATIALAWTALNEMPSRLQALGFFVALAATSLIALG